MSYFSLCKSNVWKCNPQMYISGIIGIEQLNDIINFVLNQFTNDIIQGQIDAISLYLSEVLYDPINNYLGTIKLSDIIG
jgi:hypothetical protein